MCQNTCQKWTLGDEEVPQDALQIRKMMLLLYGCWKMLKSDLICNPKNFKEYKCLKTTAISESDPALCDFWTQLTVLKHT